MNYNERKDNTFLRDSNILSLSKYAGEEFNLDLGIRTVYAGKRRAIDHKEDKNILLIGMNKLKNYLLIDAMCNFLYNIEYKSKSRYHIRNEADREHDNNGIITRYIFNQAQLSFRPIIYEISPNNNLSVTSQISTILQTISQITSLCIVITANKDEEIMYDEFAESIETIIQLFNDRNITIHISLLMLMSTGSSYFNHNILPKAFDKLSLQNKQKYFFNVDAIFSKYITDFNNIPESSEKMWNFTMTNMAGFFHHISTLNHKENEGEEGKEIKLTSILSSSTVALNEIGKGHHNTNKDNDIVNTNIKEENKNGNEDNQSIASKKESIKSKTSSSTIISIKSETTTLPKEDYIKKIIIQDVVNSFGEISLTPEDEMAPRIGKTTYLNGNDLPDTSINPVPISVSKYSSVQSLQSQNESLYSKPSLHSTQNFEEFENRQIRNSPINAQRKTPSPALSRPASLSINIGDSPQIQTKKTSKQYTPRFTKTHHHPIPEEEEEFEIGSNISHSISLLSETASIKHIRSRKANNWCPDCVSCVFYLIAPLFIILVFFIVILTIIFLT
uniref:VWFA domain-containing protein n=1 Tax=Parastrongyloides trichosuri TaxID=131310 RepID=A0A0N4Z0V3_PARTI